MAVSVDTVFTVEDKVSKKLNLIASNASSLGSSFRSLEKETNKALASSHGSRLAEDMARVDNEVKKTKTHLNELASSTTGVHKGFLNVEAAASGLAPKLAKSVSLIYALKKGVDGLVSLTRFSDEITNINSRLMLAVDNTTTLAETQELVRKKAKETKADYMVLANTVSRIGINAKDAFKSTEEAVDFAGTLNQAFMLSGASAEEVAGATRQLTQALASGVLRGDELNSVMEQAPKITEALSNKLGVTTGEIRALAAEGKLSAEIVKEAVLESADAINSDFQKMNGTLSGTIRNGLKNELIGAFEEPAGALNALFNSDGFMMLASGVVSMIGSISGALTVMINFINSGLGILADNWKYIGGVVKWVGVLIGSAFMAKALFALTVVGAKAIATAVRVGIAWAIANAPVLLIGAAIGGLILILGKLGVTTDDVAGVIGGAFGAIGAAGKNVVLFLAKAWAFFFNATLGKLKTLLFIVEQAGTLLTGKEVRFEFAHKALDAGDNLIKTIEGWEYSSVGEGWRKGKAKGQEIWNNVKEFKNPFANTIGQADYGKGIGLVKDDDETKAKLGKIESNTAGIRDSLKESLNSLSVLTKSALTNRVTVIHNHNKLDVRNEFKNADSSFDIDGLGTSLGASLLESINSGSEGVLELA